LGSESLEGSERSVFCSGCYNVFPESKIHVIPHFNETVMNYVTTYRCNECWLSALDDTTKRLARASANELAQVAEFFGRHNVSVDESAGGNQPEVLRAVLLRMIELIRTEVLKLTIGETFPISRAFGSNVH
jgi:hypothetical protein